MNNISKFRPEANSHIENVKKLSSLSKELKPKVESEEFKTLKQALISVYSPNDKMLKFQSAKQWAEEGFELKANSKAYMFWGSPRTSEKDGKTTKFYPVVYLYSENQVKAKK